MNVIVPEKLVERARQLTGLKTKQAVVEEALRLLILFYEHDEARTETERSWSEAFRGSAVPFIDQLIDENQELFEELAHR